MRKGTCKTCDKSLPLNSLFRVNDHVYCESCGDQELARLSSEKALRREVVRLSDNTICSKCGFDNGSSELATVSNSPFCAPCRETLYKTTFPGWLQAGLVGLAGLFLFALYHDRPYFNAERELIRGERFVGAKRYQEAVPHLEAALKVAPRSEHVVLAAGKAYYLSGDVHKAGQLLEAFGNFEANSQFNEVQAISNRVGKAFEESDKADESYQKKEYVEALRHMQAAEDSYPEFVGFHEGVRGIKIAAAFDSKNYDEFVRLSDAEWKQNPQSSSATSALASALACKYAATGDAAFKQRAEELLTAADGLSKTPEEKEAFQEYAPRIRYRLDSRVIIDKDEYDRRFRPELMKKEKTEKKG